MNPLLDLSAHPVVGHRGAAGLAPENTIESFELALAQGADALELDVRLAADGVPVVMHDPTLNRTTDRTGAVAELTSLAIRAADAGYRFTGPDSELSRRGRGVVPPLLRQVLERFETTPMLIELKVAEVAPAVRRLLEEFRTGDRVVIGSFLEAALAPFRGSPFPTSASRRGITRLWLRSLVGLPAPRIPDRAYAVPDRYRKWLPVPTTAFIRQARAAGRPVHVWTVDDPERARMLWGRGASGMITNFPARLVIERNRRFT